MPANKARQRAKSSSPGLRQTAINLVLYSLLLMATPFLMLRNYLQISIRRLSELHIDILGLNLHLVVSVAIVSAAVILIIYRRKVEIYHIAVFLAALLLVATGQKTADFYLDFNYYDLQNNWHYIAYCIFAYVAYRHFSQSQAGRAGIMIMTITSALLISAIDEGVQVFISSRVFDISDIAKDTWGATIGILVINFLNGRKEMLGGLKHVRHRNIAGYARNPMSLAVLLTVLSYIFLFVSSLLTDTSRWHMIFIITAGLFLVFFAVFHLSQYRAPAIAIIAASVLAIGAQGYYYIRYHDDNIVYNGGMLTIYKGIVLPYFDIMIFPDGSFRFTDKKEIFIDGDLLKIYRQKADILLIGSGPYGDGGKMVNHSSFAEYDQFLYNKYTGRGMQVGILDNQQACRMYNELVKSHYKVLFIIHNS